MKNLLGGIMSMNKDALKLEPYLKYVYKDKELNAMEDILHGIVLHVKCLR